MRNSLIVLGVMLALCSACSGVRMRVLSSEPAGAPRPEPQPSSAEPTAPRIGAPGGSGAGQRSVWPAQSGNDAVGGLLFGNGKTGRRG